MVILCKSPEIQSDRTFMENIYIQDSLIGKQLKNREGQFKNKKETTSTY
jgi:hypothetical protein